VISHAALAEIAGNAYRGPYSGTVALDVQYDLLPRGDELVVAIPGTDPASVLDWIRDARTIPRWIDGLGLVHSGFGGGAAALWRKIDGDMRPRGLITYVGHSLGGAIAQALGVLHAQRRDFQTFRVVTFGAPRLAFLNRWPARQLALGMEAVAYARDGDIVPDVPMRPLYWHPTRPTRIGVSTGDFIADHSIARYADDLKTLNL
jgi:pimeloyl-ACP methyl ester carboxylesterase